MHISFLREAEGCEEVGGVGTDRFTGWVGLVRLVFTGWW